MASEFYHQQASHFRGGKTNRGLSGQQYYPNRYAFFSFLALLPKLNALTAAKDVYRQTGISSGFGLYQGDKIDSGITVAYERLLRENFMTLVTLRLKERMQGDEGKNLDILYQLLSVYLMFNEPARMDAKVAQPWIKLDWERLYATDPEAQAKLQIIWIICWP